MSKPTVSELTRKDLQKYLSYDPDTGEFRWRYVSTRPDLIGKIAGKLCKDGYRRIRIQGEGYQAGRLAFLYMTGRWPVPTVDHDNRDRSDDRWCNLVEASHSAQNLNRSICSEIQSGYPGIYWRPSRECWRVRICRNGKRPHVGFFETLEAAVKAQEDAGGWKE